MLVCGGVVLCIVYEMSQDPEKSEAQKAVMWNQGDDDQI